MKQVLVSGAGEVHVCDVPEPIVAPGAALVRTAYSLISSGTEGAQVSGRRGVLGLWQKVLENPDRLHQAWALVEQRGIASALASIRGKLADFHAPGYSSAGVVVEATGTSAALKPGDRVACMGAGIAVHAEFAVVPTNLMVPVPPSVELRDASFSALLCIAMQGVRRLECGPGEIVGVIGLGLIGQITLRLLSAMGYRAIGFDLRGDRAEAGKAVATFGAWNMSEIDPIQLCRDLSNGHGADGVIVTAATASSDPVNLAFDLCRPTGRVSLVGDVGLSLKREKMYRKELDLRISCSYGPGRYDDDYELRGRDYPYGRIRWTERRNLEYALSLLAEGRLTLGGLISDVIPVEQANAAYKKIKDSPAGTFGVLFQYGDQPGVAAAPRTDRRSITLMAVPQVDGAFRLGVIGAGAFARSTHLPNLATLNSDIQLAAIASLSGVSAVAASRRFRIPTVTTDYREILDDASIDAVLIATRHSTHAQIVIDALSAGKHVFVEKPLCLSKAEGDSIVEAAQKAGRIVQVGFNRRYAPMLGLLRAVVGTTGVRSLTCRVNVGALGDDWSNTAHEGGRLIGEAVHFFDLCNWFIGAEASDVQVARMGRHEITNPNSVVTLAYEDGSVAQVIYTTIGHPSAGKEYFEAAGNGRMAICNNYGSFHSFGSSISATRAARGDKGLLGEWQGFVAALRGQRHAIERPDEYAGLAATRIALRVLGSAQD